MSAKKQKIGECHFRVQSEFITDRFRDFVIEERWMYALKHLVEDIGGMTHEIAIEILSGQKILSGWDDEIELVDDPDSAEYIKRMNYMYRGILEHRDGHCYRPGYQITSFGKEDYPTDENGAYEHPDNFPEDSLMYYRSMHYKHNQNDVYFVIDGVPTYFVRVDTPPMWIETYRTPEESFITNKEHTKYIDEDGWKERYQTNDSKECVIDVTNDFKWVDMTPKQIEESVEDALEEAKEKAYQNILSMKRNEIVKQAEAGDGFIELKVYDFDDNEEIVRIPKSPFYYWADQYNISRIVPKYKWNLVCHSGMKMSGDNPYHTDWWLGAGLDLYNVYDHDGTTHGGRVTKAAFRYLHDMDDRLDEQDHKVNILVKSSLGHIQGKVYKPGLNDYDIPEGCVIVIPFAGPEYQIAAQRACTNRGVVITEVGGKLCHLAKVGREMKLNLVSHPDALSLLKEGDMVNINMNDGELVIIEE